MNAPLAVRSDDLAWCHDAVRQRDRDRFLCSVFAPQDARAGLWALAAFNLELAHIRAAVTDPLPGQIRCQWWREAVSEAYAGAPRAHPVVRLLAATLPGRVPEADLLSLIDARAADLETGGAATLTALENYLTATAGRLQALAAQFLAGAEPLPASTFQAAAAVGTAWGLVGMIRAVALQAETSQLILPRAEMKAAGVREGDLMQRKMTTELAGLLSRMGERAEAQCAAARALAPVARPVLPALLLGVLAEGALRQLRRRDWNPFGQGLEHPATGTLVRLWWRARQGRW